MPPKNPTKQWRELPTAAAAFTIEEFCAAHRLSPSMYFKLKAAGEGPREMHVGARRMISAEAASRWRAEREVAARNTT